MTLLRRLFKRQRPGKHLKDEVQSFLQHEIDARVERGMEPGAARRSVRIDLGVADKICDDIHSSRTGAWPASLRHDIIFAFRSFRQAPGFSIAVIGSLSLGMAAMVVGFAFMVPLTFPSYSGVTDPDRVLSIGVDGRCGADNCWHPTTLSDLTSMRSGIPSLSGLAAFVRRSVTVGFREPRSVTSQFVSQNFFTVLGTQARVGRLYREADGNFENEGVVISYGTWTREFARSPAILAQTMRIANRNLPIIGVTPEGFRGFQNDSVDLWLPFVLESSLSSSTSTSRITDSTLNFVGRLAPGAHEEQFTAQADAVTAQIAEAQSKATRRGRIYFFGTNTRFQRFRTIAFVGTVLAIPVLVLFIACVNAANLMFSRAVLRAREIAIRMAIGASRSQIIRQILVESLIFALAAGSIGVLLAGWVLRYAEQVLGTPLPVDNRVLLLTLATAFVCTMEFGLGPAVSMASQSAGRAIGTSFATDAGPDRTRTQRTLLIVQVALSLGLLITGQELVTRLRSKYWLNTGSQQQNLLLTYFDLNQLRITGAESEAFYRNLLDRVSRLPQVEAAAVGPSLWMTNQLINNDGALDIWLDANTKPIPSSGGVVSINFARATGLRIITGRDFVSDDFNMSRPRVAIVSSAYEKNRMAGHALGKVIRVANYRPVPRSAQSDAESFAASSEVQVVGVIESMRQRADAPDGNYSVYLPIAANAVPQARMLYMRYRDGAGNLKAAVRQAVAAIDDRVPILMMGSLEDIQTILHPDQLLGRAVELLGQLALFLATAGLYAGVSFAVARRCREIAIRMTLGAKPQTILAMMLGQSLTPALVGAIGGALVSISVTSLFLFWNNEPIAIDRMGFAHSALELTIAMIIAAIVPALKASRVDPMVNLKEE